MRLLRAILFSAVAGALLWWTNSSHAGPRGNVDMIVNVQVMFRWQMILGLIAAVFGICVSCAGAAIAQMVKGNPVPAASRRRRKVSPGSTF